MPPFVSASALIEREGRVLVVVDAIRREPVLPGGHLKWRETPQDALVREVWEETGYLIKPVDLLTVVAGKEWAGEPGVVRVVYTARIIGGALKSSAEGEACWDDVESLTTSSTRDGPILRLWRERDQAVSL
jgi:ADP-ribose pyrophosphatase YjhB (NUDIX family)